MMAAQEAAQLSLELIEPAKVRYSAAPVDIVVTEARDGELAIMEGHTSLLAQLRMGRCTCRSGKAERKFAVSGGILEVRGNKVKVFTRAVEEDKDIDVERAQRARARATKRLKEQKEGLDAQRARAALLRALNRLRIKGVA
jgi:F-type H+-transporting ATPase subunit epsilon